MSEFCLTLIFANYQVLQFVGVSISNGTISLNDRLFFHPASQKFFK